MTRVSEKATPAWSTGLRREESEMLLAGNELNAYQGHFPSCKTQKLQAMLEYDRREECK